ncbi:uncharacterized protein LOC107266816 isoform X2 [Cephus cinctus]|nr:uncharacterized protein LOC107266816 isoform X2 [Cephus cinctus]
MTKLPKTTAKEKNLWKHHFEKDNLYLGTDSVLKDSKRCNRDTSVLYCKSGSPLAIKNAKQNENTYKSILKGKRMTVEEPSKKFNMEVTDKLVAQVVARAQRLRGVILKETHNEDLLALSECSTLDSFHSDSSVENEAKLYEYFLGKKMSHHDERKALETLRSMSPSPSLLNLASETIESCKNNKIQEFKKDTSQVTKSDPILEEIFSRETIHSIPKEPSPLEHVDCLKIFIESLTLSSAGYRRVKSSCLFRGDGVPLSVTYFIQYDTAFIRAKQPSRQFESHRPTKLCSKKQIGQVVYFNHQAIYDISQSCLSTDLPLKFKIFIRHLNQRTPTELGVGSIYINEVAKTEYLSMIQKLAIVNKGIKIGELKVSVELGCERIHFGKHFVDAINSTKENIPILEVPSSVNLATDRYRTATGTESKTNSRATSASTKQIDCRTNENNLTVDNRKDITERKKQNGSDRTIGIETPGENYKDKVLLHGLIYIAEGKDLPQSNTYLICRAFWREDRAASRLCSNTDNPFYHFHQLVPLLHGPDVLERTKDNCIVTEVYSRSNAGVDSLLGIAKLPVHQLYVAYRDPLVLPHLLLSKYPVISVDGWVPVADPVTGRSCGQLLALVALGTADQIALLEMTRGLRECIVTPRTIHNCTSNPNHRSANLQGDPEEAHDARATNYNQGVYTDDNLIINNRATNMQNFKSQECQTEISTVDVFNGCSVLNAESSGGQTQNSVLHALVDRLAQALNVPKTGTNQTVKTQTGNFREIKRNDGIETLCLNPSSNNSISDNSSDGSPRDNFQMPTELYRSVGVGAEFDEATNLAPSTSYGVSMPNPISTTQPAGDEQLDADAQNYEDPSFRAVVEVECALHLPKVEKPEGTYEPSTYVTFQKVQSGYSSQFGSYIITNVCVNSCNPKWEWRCDTRLPTELLVNDEKRLILKVWRLSDPQISTTVDLDKDIVIGFSAIDLSVLTAGFPLVSGWFHIMDFTGKCNGQIKVSVTPLDNISTFGKSTSTTSITKTQLADPLQPNLLPPREQNITLNSATVNNLVTSCNQEDIEKLSTNHNQVDIDTMADIGLELGGASMSFLSLSLKQKLTELDEITKRLQSRLHDVTNAPFDDDFENDFDPNEPEMEVENNENGNVQSITTLSGYHNNELWQSVSTRNTQSPDRNITANISRTPTEFQDIQSRSVAQILSDNNTISFDGNLTDTGYSTSSNLRSSQNLSNGNHMQQIQTHRYSNESLCENHSEHPTRGTKTHISHLLDKLSSQLTAAPPPSGNFTMKRNIIDLISSLRHNNNNFQNDAKCNQEVNVRTVPTQADAGESEKSTRNKLAILQNQGTSNVRDSNTTTNSSLNEKSHKRSRVSALIREELVTEENNDATECDDLTTHLITSNVRHMDLDSIFNPLLYPHLIPDVQIDSAVSIQSSMIQDFQNLNSTPEGEAVEQLDNRYTQTFNATLNNGLSRIRNLVELDTSLMSESASHTRVRRSSLDTPDNMEIFRLTPSGISENIDGNIDITVIHKPTCDELMASNSTDSTTTISMEKSSASQTRVDVDDASSLSSESLVSAVSRQAPDGGNPVEETGKPSMVNCQDALQDSSSDS